ncbi:MAG: metallophosphoesterase [Acidimicrobiia bacterium]
MTTYDVIGDVHGHADALEQLLAAMGYRQTGGAYRHPERRAVFIGDLIDRGPDQLRTLDIARRMVDAGSALAVLGNHELNAVAWATRDDAGDWCRPHTEKNRGQHAAFLAAVGEGSPRHREWIGWFETLPMWLDLGGLRIVHACWHPASMDVLGDGTLTREIVSAEKGDPLDEAVEVVLKGPEIHMGGHAYIDKDGHRRDKARLRWWCPDADTLATAAEIPDGATACDGSPLGPLPDTPLDRDALPDVPLDVPVLYGHYWRTGHPAVDHERAACLDWSIANGGQLVAYRWWGEPELTDDNLVAAR